MADHPKQTTDGRRPANGRPDEARAARRQRRRPGTNAAPPAAGSRSPSPVTTRSTGKAHDARPARRDAGRPHPARAASSSPTSSPSSRSTPTRSRGRVDRRRLVEAFVFACEHHADQRRQSGEEFIVHPVGVAKICAGMRLDTETLCAALLHDTVEDTTASLDEVREAFGEEIAGLVDGVTKLTGITFQSRDEAQAENYRKMMVAMATDVRVILIKLADRLHNMRTLERDAEAEADREGQGDARHLRAAGAPARHPRDQVGARGPLVLRPCTRASTRRSRAWSASSATSASATSPRPAATCTRSSRRSASRPRSPAAPSTSTRSTRR